MFTLLLALCLHDSLPPYHTRKQFGEFYWRTWNPKNQTDTIFQVLGNGFWLKGDTIVYHWWPSGTEQPKGPLLKGKVEYGYDNYLSYKKQ